MSKPHNVFISWSGKRSQHAAKAMANWLPMVIQAAEPWMSDTSIQKGTRGLDEIGRALEGIKVGIVCLTPENLTASWVLFESGALSKTIDENTRLCTYLLGGLRPQDVELPLGMFQHTRDDEDDTRKLIHTINKSVSSDPLPESRLNAVFDTFWQRLKGELQAMPEPEKIVDAKRSAEEMLAEILEFTRAEANRRKETDIFDQYRPAFAELLPTFLPLLSEIVKTARMQQDKVSAPASKDPPTLQG